MSENFRLIYYDVGQGDCILVVCPDDRLVMIDCGSSKGLTFDEKIDIAVDIRKFTNRNKGKLDALILTHPDKDHYNLVVQLLFKSSYIEKGTEYTLDTVTFEDVYFSETIVQGNEPMWNYGVAAIGANIKACNFKTQNLHHIIIKADDQRRLTYSQDNDFAMPDIEPIQNHRYSLMHGVTPGNQQWEISLLAGGVTGVDNTNPMSLATLLEIGPNKEYKALMLGDATVETEAFLLATHEQLISNVKFVHVPHHGSDTSSGRQFVRTVNPKGAQETMQTAETSSCLPKATQTKRWMTQINNEKEVHFVDYWEIAEDTKVNAELNKWFDNPKYKGYIRTSGEGAKYYLDIGKITGFTGYYYLAHERMLYRGTTKQNLWQTGVSGLTEWLLPSNFL